MILQKVEFNNYRCFEHLEIDLKSKINLLIGENSSGKSTIIKGFTTVLNSFFVGYNDENTHFIGLSKDDFTIFQTKHGIANDKPIKIDFKLLGTVCSLELHSKKGRTLQRPLTSIYDVGKKLYTELFNNEHKQNHDLPLFACFSTSDIHKSRKNSVTAFKRYELKPSFGYYECLQGDGFLSYWTKRLLILKEAGKGLFEIEGVVKGLLDAFGPNGCQFLSEINIRPNQGKVYYRLADGREVETDHLSDGYRRLVNIVLDISFRALILNQGIYGVESCQKTSGTVLIDELDLHLHPALQVLIFKGLSNAFPLIQWVVTSHAPMIMANIPLNEDNIIFKLDYDQQSLYTKVILELYGLDASAIIESALQTTPRSKEVEIELDELFDLIDEEDYENGFKLLIKLQNKFGGRLPELSKASTMLDFLPRKK